tara:strand:+ start:210 stop:464 length:255 start_codon:yes stop_codon:yes gene_type:complete
MKKFYFMSIFSVNYIFQKKNISLIFLIMILKKLINFIYLKIFFIKKINPKLNFIKQKVIVNNFKNIFILDEKLIFVIKNIKMKI